MDRVRIKDLRIGGAIMDFTDNKGYRIVSFMTLSLALIFEGQTMQRKINLAGNCIRSVKEVFIPRKKRKNNLPVVKKCPL